MNHHLVSLGWTLVHFCWQAGAIALAYWLADVGLAKANSQTRYLVALLAMLLMLGSALATFGYEEAQSYESVSSQGSFPAASVTKLETALPLDLATTAVTNATQASLEINRILPWLDFAWLLGVACLSTRTIGGWWLVQRLRRGALFQAPEVVRASFSRLCQRMGISRAVTLRISERVPGPLTIGVVRSLIIVPASALMSLSPEQLEAVLAHELAHVRRADYFWNLMQTMVETLFFFHPAVWWLGRRLRQERELCCDDIAVQSCADPLIYATALLRMEERRAQQLNLAMALDGHKPWSGLRDRIARILGDNSGKASREERPRELVPIPLVAICSLLVLLLLPVPHIFAGLRKPVQAPPAAFVTAAVQSPTPAVTPAPDAAAASRHHVPRPEPSAVVVESPDVSSIVATASTIGSEAARTAALVAADAARREFGAGEGAGVGAGEGAGVGAGIGADDVGEQATGSMPGGPDYIDKMRAAGYEADLGQYIAMKVQGITPEYAQEMAKAGFGKPSAGELIAMKVQGITPKYVSDLHAAGIEPRNFGDLVSYKIFGVTPEFVTGMKAAGFDSIPPQKLVALRVHGVTPEYAKKVKQQYPSATLDELVQLRIFHIDDAFLAAAKRHGFDSLSIQKLVQLRISGVLGDEDGEAK
ncbi:MAG TPA: M56 family metallopeptidase [Acidobacteriaceae bacterium]|nr:M56 family metallopeptidase [Acidobacteriaceae bacterium]